MNDTAEERLAFARLIHATFSLYPGSKPPSDDALDLWWGALRAHDFKTIRAALSRHATNPDVGQYPPKPADVIREIGGTTADASMLAWNKAMEAVRHVGSYECVLFDVPITNRVIVDLGGWPAFCAGDEKDTGFKEKRFRDAYRAYRVRGLVGTEPVSRLPGRVEIENNARGFVDFIPPLKLIGDRSKAEAISKGASDQKLIGAEAP